MARRSRRRGRFKRHKPDMGWFVGGAVQQLTTSGGGAWNPVTDAIMSFDDINNDDPIIAQDKSDWFIKRVIIDAYPTLGRASTGTSAPTRLWELGIGTMDITESTALDATTNETIVDPDTYERWRRLFKTYSRPVYATLTLGLTSSGELVTADAGTINEVNVVDSPWGESSIHDDFTVSNAGLVHNSGVYLALTPSNNVSPNYEWLSGESLTVGYTYRILLQKRRT